MPKFVSHSLSSDVASPVVACCGVQVSDHGRDDGSSYRLCGGRALPGSKAPSKRRPVAIGPDQLRWRRRIGQARPLGHRRHRGCKPLWKPPCYSCSRPGRWVTHQMVPCMVDAVSLSSVPSSMTHTIVAAVGALIRSGSATLKGEALAVQVEQLLRIELSF